MMQVQLTDAQFLVYLTWVGKNPTRYDKEVWERASKLEVPPEVEEVASSFSLWMRMLCNNAEQHHAAMFALANEPADGEAKQAIISEYDPDQILVAWLDEQFFND